MQTRQIQRRQEPRNRPQYRGVAWSRGCGNQLCRGTLIDASKSGIGLEVMGEDMPRHGDVLRILSLENAEPRRVRVVRVENGPSGAVRLGCKWVTTSDRAYQSHTPPGRHFPSHSRLLPSQ